jgi:hypothetical protein
VLPPVSIASNIDNPSCLRVFVYVIRAPARVADSR